jgi:hypothetical protein
VSEEIWRGFVKVGLIEALSLAAPLIYAAVGAVLSILIGYLNRGRLRRAFGSNLSSADEIILVISSLYSGRDANDKVNLRKREADNSFRAIERADDFRLVADGDFRAAVDISFAVQKAMREPITLKFDEQTFDWYNQTMLLVGAPISNLWTKSVMQLSASDPETSCFYIDGSVNSAEEQTVVDNHSTEKYFLSDEFEYAFIDRRVNPNSHNHYIYIIAGQTKFGTEAAGAYFKNHWRLFSRVKRSGDAAGVLLKLGRRAPGAAKVEATYNLRR